MITDISDLAKACVQFPLYEDMDSYAANKATFAAKISSKEEHKYGQVLVRFYDADWTLRSIEPVLLKDRLVKELLLTEDSWLKMSLNKTKPECISNSAFRSRYTLKLSDDKPDHVVTKGDLDQIVREDMSLSNVYNYIPFWTKMSVACNVLLTVVILFLFIYVV